MSVRSEPPRAPLRAVFFDVGGTLVRSKAARWRILHGALLPLGFMVAEADANRAYRRLDTEYAGRTFPPERGVEGSRRFWTEYDRSLLSILTIPYSQKADDAIQTAFAEFVSRPTGENYEAFPDALPCLLAIRNAGLKTGAISNADGRLSAILRATGLDEQFDLVVNSSEERIAKPDPRIFRIALDRLGVHAEESVHVGDLYHFDVLGARAVGIRPVLIDRGTGESHDDEDLSLCEVVRSLDELPVLLGL